MWSSGSAFVRSSPFYPISTNLYVWLAFWNFGHGSRGLPARLPQYYPNQVFPCSDHIVCAKLHAISHAPQPPLRTFQEFSPPAVISNTETHSYPGWLDSCVFHRTDAGISHLFVLP